MERGNWTDKRCYYVCVRDGKRFSLLAGPFAHQRQAAAAVDKTRLIAIDYDNRGVFYTFGTCKKATGHREGLLNKEVDIDTLPHKPRDYVARPACFGFGKVQRLCRA